VVAVEDLNAEGDASDAGFAAAWHVKWQEECGEISADISKPVKARSLGLGSRGSCEFCASEPVLAYPESRGCIA
jgi:hypothetical protein